MGDEVEEEQAENGEDRDEVDGTLRPRARSDKLLHLDILRHRLRPDSGGALPPLFPLLSATVPVHLELGPRRSERLPLHAVIPRERTKEREEKELVLGSSLSGQGK